MGAKKHERGYKRSWKNLLLNKRYQLRFTLFMVGLSAVLMALLGWWVMKVADRATKVAINNVLGEEVCKDPAAVQAAAADEAAAAAQEPAPASQPPPVAEGDSGRKKPVVTIEESEMQILDTPPAGAKPEEPVAE